MALATNVQIKRQRQNQKTRNFLSRHTKERKRGFAHSNTKRSRHVQTNWSPMRNCWVTMRKTHNRNSWFVAAKENCCIFVLGISTWFSWWLRHCAKATENAENGWLEKFKIMNESWMVLCICFDMFIVHETFNSTWSNFPLDSLSFPGHAAIQIRLIPSGDPWVCACDNLTHWQMFYCTMDTSTVDHLKKV